MSATPTGGWLRRIATGATAAWAEDAVGDDAEPVKLTPRMLLVLDELAAVNRRNPLAWVEARDVSRATGVGAGLAAELMGRLQASGLAESQRVGHTHHRAYRLTPEGAIHADAVRGAEPLTAVEATEMLDRLRETLVDSMATVDDGDGVTDQVQAGTRPPATLYPSNVLAFLDGYGIDADARRRWYADGQHLRYSKASSAEGERVTARWRVVAIPRSAVLRESAMRSGDPEVWNVGAYRWRWLAALVARRRTRASTAFDYALRPIPGSDR